MDLGLSGKKAVVTGGSRGIGLAIIQTLLAEGAEVATCARGEDALRAKLDEWRQAGHTAYGDAVDVTDEEAFSAWLERAGDQLGGVDIFISNVTTQVQSKGLQRWQDSFDVNLKQHVLATNQLLPRLRESSQGSIVYISSIAAVMSSNMPTETEYGATKAALISYAAQLATQLGKDGIRVNAISPGPIYHDQGFWQMVEQKNPQLFERAKAVSVFDRLGTAQEVANATVFLASPAASNITGVNLRVDGAAIKTVNF